MDFSFIIEHWLISYLIFTTILAILAFIFEDKRDEFYSGIIGFLISLFAIPIIIPFVAVFIVICIVGAIVIMLIYVFSIIIELIKKIFYRTLRRVS